MGFNFRKHHFDREAPLDAEVESARIPLEPQAVIGNHPEPDDAMSRDLMVLIGRAIETWAQKYNLENMPKDIVFSQAMVIMKRAEELLRQHHL